MESFMSIIPPFLPGIFGVIVTLVQFMIAFTSYGNEVNPETRAKYSKFATATVKRLSTSFVKADDNSNNNSMMERNENKKNPITWSSQKGMMIIYTPALLVSTALFTFHIVPPTSLGSIMVILHFLKRVLEVLFVHVYSGSVDRQTPITIGIYYTLVALLTCCAADHNPTYMIRKIGTRLFVIGLVGNFYHHYLLAQLRRRPTTTTTTPIKQQEQQQKRYVAPRGGLFEYVATPHYLFEIIGWFGVAVASNHSNVYLIAAGMTSYLAGRSVAQNEFNRNKFDKMEWPKERKNLVPYLF